MDNLEFLFSMNQGENNVKQTVAKALSEKLALDEPISKDDVVSTIQGIDVGAIVQAVVKKSGIKLSDVTNTDTIVKDYIYANAIDKNSLIFVNATSIGNNAMQSCVSLTSVNMLNVASIGSGAMQNCVSLTSVNMPNVASIGNNAMYNCISLANVDTPNVTSIGNYAMQNCVSLISVNTPNVTSISNYAMHNCVSLTSVNMLNVASIGSGAMQNCVSLTSVNMPNVASIGNNAMYNCISLANVDTPNVTSIGSGAMQNCLFLKTLKLGANQVATLANTNALQNTPIANGTGYIYVPDELVEDYKSATNWSVYADQIRPMSEYVEE